MPQLCERVKNHLKSGQNLVDKGERCKEHFNGHHDITATKPWYTHLGGEGRANGRHGAGLDDEVRHHRQLHCNKTGHDRAARV